MTIEELKNQYGHLFNIVHEPDHSKQKLIEYQCSYPYFSSHDLYWLYKIEGFKNEVLNLIPTADDWCYYYERFLKYGGNDYDLKSCNNFEDTQILMKNNDCYIDEEEVLSSSSYSLSFLECIILKFSGLHIISDISNPYTG